MRRLSPVFAFIAFVVSIPPGVAALDLPPALGIRAPYVDFVPGASCDYLIIAPAVPGIVTQARRIAGEKTACGLRSQVVTTDSIDAVVPGMDQPARIRTFIARQCSTGTRWVLILGDYRLVPARVVYFDQSLQQPPIASDIYYQCLGPGWECSTPGLDGDVPEHYEWTIDSTGALVAHLVGGYSAYVDYTVHACVGRMPASDSIEAAVMAGKIIGWGRVPVPQLTYALCGTTIVQRTSDCGPVNDATCLLYNQSWPSMTHLAPGVRPDFLFVDSIDAAGRADSANLTIDRDGFVAQLSRKPALQIVAAHGNNHYIQLNTLHLPQSTFGVTEIASLSNTGAMQVISLSCGVMCMNGDTQQCYAKAFLLNPKVPTCAFFGSPVSDFLDQWKGRLASAFSLMADSGVASTALSLALSTGSLTQHEHRFKASHCFWGDPAMTLRRRSIGASDTLTFAIDFKTPGRMTVSLNPAVDGALVCLYEKGRIFKRGYAAQGTVVFDSMAGFSRARLTASHRDYLTSSVIVDSTGTAVIAGHALMAAAANAWLHTAQRSGILAVDLRLADRAGVLAIYDFAGRRFFHRRLFGGSCMRIDIPGLAPGGYLVILDTGGKRLSQRNGIAGRP